MANSNEQNGFDQQGQGAAPQQDSTYVPGVIQEQQVIPSPKPQQDAQQPAQGQADWQQAQPQNQGWQPQNPQQGQQGWQAPQGQGWQMPNGQSWQQPNGQQWQQPQGQNWQEMLERFQTALNEKFDKASIHLRMGVKPWQEGLEPESQFDKARAACNLAKSKYKTQIMVYDAGMEQHEERDQRLLNDLPRALERHELEVYYQPKYDIRPEKPKLASAEALVRWKHPELGMIAPEDFIALFEKSGQISILDNYVWKEAARQIAD